jgi:hypothetical protein
MATPKRPFPSPLSEPSAPVKRASAGHVRPGALLPRFLLDELDASELAEVAFEWDDEDEEQTPQRGRRRNVFVRNY